MTPHERQIWPGMLTHLKRHAPTICRQWFEEIEPVGVSGGVLRLRAHSNIHRDYLQRQCAEPFNDAARGVSQMLLTVQFLGPDEHDARAPGGGISPAHSGAHSAARDGSGAGSLVEPAAASPRSASLADDIAGRDADWPAGDSPGRSSSPGKGSGITKGLSPASNLHPSRAGVSPSPARSGPASGGGGGGGVGGGVGGAAAVRANPLRAGSSAGGATLIPATPAHPASPARSGGRESFESATSGLRRESAAPGSGAGGAAMGQSVSRPSPLSLALNPDYTFDNFVMGPSNRLAHAAAQAVAEKPGRTYNPFFVHGSVGLGKTHLLQAVCLRILQTSPGAKIYYTSCEGFMTQFMDAVQAGEMSAFRHTFRDVDVLAIDDVHFLAKRDRTQEEFFHTFNSLYQSQKQIILSSDAPPEDIPDLEDRLVSRFKWGLVSHIGPPCYETRIAILKNKAKMRGFELGDDVACHIAARIDSNIRELEGAIVKLQVTASVMQRPIDMEMAQEALGPDSSSRGEKQVQIQSIIDVVTQYYGVKLTDLQSKRRHRSVAIPRQVCMFLCRRHTRFSLEEIGGYFGGRDHTTVMHAVKTIEQRAEVDADFAQVLKRLDDQIRMPTVG